ncbi:NADPH-ferrihemoprotein reductase [Nematocida minor]|uniref:NADPH-ferrihemoprotein reductase n=1 Tax=Nematocida minor TaxID=1912983 RepID=UPI00221F5E6E|nr:NADPH-ferrihemoprotein reductase [Nematocida minor]KAI5192133.1 NADPH-ferrihemoprotein reductase [Nematocida minor]
MHKKYIARAISTSAYTPERKPHTFTRLHSVSLAEKTKCKDGESLVLYKDKHTMAETSTSSASQETQLNPSTIYTFHTETLYAGRQTSIKMTVRDRKIEYVPGDSILLWVSNSESIANTLMELLDVPADRWISFQRIHNRTSSVVFSFAGMASDYFRHFLDTTSLPSKLFLYRLSEYACEEEKDKLAYLSSKEGSAEYFMMIRNWNSIIDILIQFRVKVPLEVLLEVCTEIKPRAFSLINKKENDIELIVGVISNSTEESTRNGHFSEYAVSTANSREKTETAEDTDKNMRIFDSSIAYRIQLKANRLLRLREETTNALLFGIGTGVAPFISFIRNHGSSCKFSLFYGCRNRDENILVKIGLVSGPGEESKYAGAVLFRVGPTDVHVVYSRESMCLRMHDFLAKNKEKIDDECKQFFNDLYICGNKGAMAAVSAYFEDAHPNMKKYIDDWS